MYSLIVSALTSVKHQMHQSNHFRSYKKEGCIKLLRTRKGLITQLTDTHRDNLFPR